MGRPGGGTLVDTASHVAPNLDHPLIPRTQNSFGFTEIYFPGATGFIPQKDIPESVQIQPLAWTSRESWLETNFVADETPELNDPEDKKGPFAVGVLVSRKGTRLAVIGDSDFATNQHFYNGNNSDLFLNTVNMLTADAEIISVDRKVLPLRRLILSPEQVRFVHVSSIGLLPFLLLALGGYVRWRRR